MNPPKKEFVANLYQLNSEITIDLLKKGNHYLIQYSSFLHRMLEFVKGNSVAVHLRRLDLQARKNSSAGAMTLDILDNLASPKPSKLNWYVLNAGKYNSNKALERIESMLFGDFTKALYRDRIGIDAIAIGTKEERARRIQIESSEKELLLYLRPDTHQIMMQLRAINRLRHEPLQDFSPLYEIFGATHRSFQAGSEWAEMPELEWIILTDNAIEGVEEQREFVRKALYSPDFAILDGPPGSGKTTTILELILQLAKLGKRVLLCSSTHVAIDNVLFRMLDKDRDKCAPWVMPVRICTYEGQITKEIVKPIELRNLVRSKKREMREDLSANPELSLAQKAFLDYLKAPDQKEGDSIERLILESANLVAGTCTGILQHPDIKAGKGWPEFDYLIVDEASKVTFQDFIMPALHAKRWALVGDVHQLSPYVDDDSLEHFVNESVPDESERDFFLKMHSIKEELSKARKYDESLVFFTKGQPDDLKDLANGLQEEEILAMSLHRGELKARGLDLKINTADVIICEDHRDVYEFVETHLKVKARLLDKEPAPDEWARYQQALHLNTRGKPIGWTMDLLHRSWGDIVVSKITQYYSFRENSAATAQILEDLNKLIPSNYYEEIMDLKRIAFPSVLEILQRGADMSERQFTSDVFSSGLSIRAKEDRFVSVHFQHRMHPDIAEISKDHFYQEEGNLQPGSKMKGRQWHYRANASRVEWYPNSGKTTGKKDQIVNQIEADHMMRLLEEFITESAHLQRPLEVAILPFYREQEDLLSKMLQNRFCQPDSKYEFSHGQITISLCTVDRFQGQEADLVLLGFTKVGKWAHFNSPNRLNVALTRARHKLILFGNQHWFATRSSSEALRDLARFPSILHI